MHALTLRPCLQTSQVTLRPVETKDLKHYQTLLQSKLAAEDAKETSNRFLSWVQRWNFHPYSALSVTDNLSQKIIGYALLDHGDYEGNILRGHSKTALFLNPSCADSLKIEIGTEVIRSLINYARSLKDLAYKVPCNVTEKQQEELENLSLRNKELEIHRTEGKKIDWAYLPFQEMRATCAKSDTVFHKILHKTFVQENGGTVKPLSKEKDIFTLPLK